MRKGEILSYQPEEHVHISRKTSFSSPEVGNIFEKNGKLIRSHSDKR
jgi:hypothetical protein